MTKQFQAVSWSEDSNIYEVNLRQYTPEGTFNAFRKSLPRLREMAVEILWFMPITPISKKARQGTLGSYYACASYLEVNPEFGTLSDFKELVAEAQGMGFKVIIDWVANHTGYDHPWTVEHPEYYRLNLEGKMYDAHGWVDVLDLNYDNPDLHTEMINCMKFWVEETGIDGFRCDMAMLVPIHFWQKARTELDAIKPLFWLAECGDIDYHQVFDALYSWSFLHKMEAYSRGETDLRGLEDVLDRYLHAFPEDVYHTLFTSNHDENSHSGSEYIRMKEFALPFAVFTATWKGIPLIYSGQEMPNKKSLLFFEKDPIEWTGKYELADFYRRMLELRKRNKAMKAVGTSIRRMVSNADHRMYAFQRAGVGDEVLVLLNLSAETLSNVVFAKGQLSGEYIPLFDEKRENLQEGAKIELQPYGYEIYEKK